MPLLEVPGEEPTYISVTATVKLQWKAEIRHTNSKHYDRLVYEVHVTTPVSADLKLGQWEDFQKALNEAEEWLQRDIVDFQRNEVPSGKWTPIKGKSWQEGNFNHPIRWTKKLLNAIRMKHNL